VGVRVIKWLVLIALVANVCVYFWFASPEKVLSGNELSVVNQQGGRVDEVVLLSELEVIPPARRPPGLELLVGGSQRSHTGLSSVVINKPLQEVTGSRDVDSSSSDYIVSRQTSGGNLPQEDLLGEKELRAKSLNSEIFAEPLIESEPDPEPESKQKCVTLGRFNKEQDANGLLQALKNEVDVTARLNKVVEGLVRYLVYMPPFENRAMAKEMQAELRRAGMISSIYYKGDLKNGLSLGYFGSRQNAKRHYENLLASGFSVKLEVVETEVSRYEIEFEGGSDSGLSQYFWQDLAEKFPDVSRREQACSAVK
jgi:cell division septation protein DedD